MAKKSSYSGMSDKELEGLLNAKKGFIQGFKRIFSFLSEGQKDEVYSAFEDLQDIEEEQLSRKERNK